MVVYSVVCLVVFCFGVPVVLLGLLWHRRRELNPGNAGRDMVLVHAPKTGESDLVVRSVGLNIWQQQALHAVVHTWHQHLMAESPGPTTSAVSRAASVWVNANYPITLEHRSGIPSGFTSPPHWSNVQAQVASAAVLSSSSVQVAIPGSQPACACFHYHFSGVHRVSHRDWLDKVVRHWCEHNLNYDAQFDITIRDSNPSTKRLKVLVQVRSRTRFVPKCPY